MEKVLLEIIDFLGNHITNIAYDPTEIFDIINLCQDLTSEYDESHNLEHHICVYKNAIKILASENKDVYQISMQEYQELFLLITYSSLLHDTIDLKYPNNLEYKIKKLNLFLEEKIKDSCEKIKWIINNMSYSKEIKFGYPINSDKIIQLGRDIVSDSDKLEAIGEIGIQRCRQYIMVIHPNASEEEIIRYEVEHCDDKLSKLKDYFIRTNTGKKLAEPHHQVLVDFVKKNRQQ